MLKNSHVFQKQTSQLMEGRLEGDVLCCAGKYQLSEVLGETLIYHQQFRKARDILCVSG